MSRKLYLVSPAADNPSYFSTDAMSAATGRPAANVIALALPTVAALAPGDFEVALCDEAVTPVDFDHDADIVGLTGTISQWGRMQEIAAEFRRRGRVVMIGGPHATLRADAVRPHCDILVRGELEGIAGELFDDLRSGDWKPEYAGSKPDTLASPLPRIDLYPNGRTLNGALQTSRGCPFGCEFCDVIQYQGRKQRFKPIDQVLAELDGLHAAGYGHVFITDDNLTANRRRARALLEAIRDWNRGRERKLRFMTQVSVDAAGDDGMLELLAAAGVTEVFVGIETPNADSLREVGKLHNARVDLVERIERFVGAGIAVVGGMIVGFDSDDHGIFRRQYEFAMSLPVPLFTPAALFAPETTPLHARLAREGRVEAGSADLDCLPWCTNILPAQMTREELVDGLKWLCNRLYRPEAFEARLRRYIALLGDAGKRPAGGLRSLRPVDRECLVLLKRLPRLGSAEARMVAHLVLMVLRRPRLLHVVLAHLVMYAQVRHLFDCGRFWDRSLGCREAPSFATAVLAKAS